ncbi:MAG: DEAD/DEAH box helicase family protein [Candidatus Lokiarchaeota archaeon]|nr:DEAD/DEAH box helicase family protein [Candidatus Lokiarchaeota archaeon]
MQDEVSGELSGYFNEPFLKKNRVYFRQYQNNIINKCKGRNSLIVLPTGLGKTIIGVLLIGKTLEKYPESKIIILAPTRPLVSQHRASCEEFLNINSDTITSFTGKISPEKRILDFKKSKIIVSTPQVIKNDLERGRYDLKHISLIIFDEAHRTRGNYAYCFISTEYLNTCQDPLILGLTASPGKSSIHIQQLCNKLFIENVIFKTYEDNDVKQYIYDIDIYLEFVDLPIKVIELSAIWYNLFEKFLQFFIEKKLIPPNKRYYSKSDFLGISRDLTLSLKYDSGYLPELSEEEYENILYFKSPRIIDVVRENALNIQSIFSYCSSFISLLHGKDLLESQNITLLLTFLEKLEWKADQDILSAKRITNSEHYKFIKNNVLQNKIEEYSHPKIEKLFSIVSDELENYHNTKIIIFTQYREMAELLKNKFRNHFGSQLNVEKFIGQSTKVNDLGYSQDKQGEILKEFKKGTIDVLIATSVAEEGLDIPNVDAIIFYEPVPSEIRLIQRRGRTGRHGPGRCYLLVARSSIDVPFYKAADKKESAMNWVLSHSKQLELCDITNREKISFNSDTEVISEIDLIKNYRERRKREKELLADRSIEEIITELDNFVQSKEFQKFKDVGVIFYSDVIRLDKSKMKSSIIKIKGKQKEKNKKMTERKNYLNKNVKTLIKIAETYSVNGKIPLSEFKEFAEEEEIIEKKYYTHFNQACRLGYLKRVADEVHFIMSYD